MRVRELVAVTTTACAMFVGAGCKSGPEAKGETTAALKEKPAVEGTGDPVVDATNTNAVTPEQIEAVDMFFRQKAKHLQFECYNSEVDRTHKKYEGNVTISVMVRPGGKVSDAKLISNTLRSTDKEHELSPGIADCVMQNLGEWEWPSVGAPTPYLGSINFKPAW